jgi:hypothetical protein
MAGVCEVVSGDYCNICGTSNIALIWHISTWNRECAVIKAKSKVRQGCIT